MQNGEQNTEQKSSPSEKPKDEPNDQLIKIGPTLMCNRDHYFMYKSGTEIQCTKCPIGYPISQGTEIKHGHVYIHGEKVL